MQSFPTCKKVKHVTTPYAILDHDIFYFQTTLKNSKKNLSKLLNTFENILENGVFAPKEQILHFP